MRTRDELKRWIDRSHPGQWAHYWTGHLANDRRFLLVALLAETAWGAYLQGEVFLFQRREGTGFAYLAFKRRANRASHPPSERMRAQMRSGGRL